MAEQKKTRVYRSKDERRAEIEKKIQYHQNCIKTLEEKKARLENSRRGGRRERGVKRIISEAKLSDEETAKALDMTVKELRDKLNAAAEEKAGK